MPQRPYRLALDLSCLVPQPLTGVGYYTTQLFAAYFRACPEVATTIFSSGAGLQPEVIASMCNANIRARHLRFPSRARFALWERLHWPPLEWFAGEADIIHGGFHALPPARDAKRLVTVFDLSAQRRSGTHHQASTDLDQRLLRHAARHADAFIAISESCKSDLAELYGVDPARIFVVYGGVDFDLFSTPVEDALREAALARFGLENEPYLIQLGTLEPRKNIPRLLEAYAALAASIPATPKLVLAGRKGWMYEPIFDAIEKWNLQDRVCFTDYLERTEAIALLQGAVGCVYPSLYEGFGLPVLEAMAAGVPVLTSDVSSMPEVAGDTAILVDPESVDAIGTGLEQLLVRANQPGDALERARDRARQFTWDASAQSLIKAYDQILSGERSL